MRRSATARERSVSGYGRAELVTGMTGWMLLQRADAWRRLLDLFVHGVLRSFRWWPRVVPGDGLPLSTLDDSFCFEWFCVLWFLGHHSSSCRCDPVPALPDW